MPESRTTRIGDPVNWVKDTRHWTLAARTTGGGKVFISRHDDKGRLSEQFLVPIGETDVDDNSIDWSEE